MEKRIVLACAVTGLLWLLSAENSCETLMDFSRGSQRTVEIILSTKKITRMVNKTYRIPLNSTNWRDWRITFADEVNETELFQADLGELVKLYPHSTWLYRMYWSFNLYWTRFGKKSFSGLWLSFSSEDPSLRSAWSPYGNDRVLSFCLYLIHFHRSNSNTTINCQAVKVRFDPLKNENPRLRSPEAIVLVSINETVIIKQTKREVYKPRSSPSNKFMKAVNGIKRAEANANALRVKTSSATLAKLKGLVEKAIRSKSYSYAREVTGKIMYLLKTRSSRRKKRDFTDELNKFLQELREKVGKNKFDTFLAVQGDVALMFAVDDTGSMGEEISAAKKVAKHIINYKRKFPIAEYILSTFNDPYPDPTNPEPVIIKNESQAIEFQKEIDKLKAHGGGDCPENTLAGILGAVDKVQFPDSPLYVFTDAGPKDATEDKISRVRAAAKEMRLTINFMLTDYCGRSSGSRKDPKNIHPVFLSLAEGTSGQAILFNNLEEMERLSSWTIETMQGCVIVTSGSNKKRRGGRGIGSTDGRYTIPVDDSVEKMFVTINTAVEGDGIILRNTDNVEISSGKLSLPYVTIYEITNPKRGAWTLTVPGSLGDHEFSVKSSSDTNVDFEHYFLVELPSRRGRRTKVPISNPVAGKLNKVIISVAGSEKLDESSLRMQLITTKGNLIRYVVIQPRGQGKFTADFNPHSSVRSFKLKLKGTTQKGYPFERISQKIGSTTTAVAWVKYASNDQTLPLDRTTFIHFQVCNFGATEFFDSLVLKDKLGYLLRRRLSPIRAYKDRC